MCEKNGGQLSGSLPQWDPKSDNQYQPPQVSTPRQLTIHLPLCSKFLICLCKETCSTYTPPFSENTAIQNKKFNLIKLKQNFIFFFLVRLQTSFTIRPRRRLISNGFKLDSRPKSIKIEINTRKKFLNSSTLSFLTTTNQRIKCRSCKIKMHKS